MSRGGRRGESLVEVVVATLLLAVGALALAGGLAFGERARGRALEESLALAAATSWIEAWRASPWDPVARSGLVEPLADGHAGRLEWATSPLGGCREEASVTVTPPRGGPVALVTRRYGEAACEE